VEALQAIEAWPVAALLRHSPVLYPLVNAAHIASLALLFGAVAVLDLRLVGLFGRQPLGVLAPPLRRVAAAGLVLAVATGALLFTTRPVAYAANPAFLAKLALVGAALANLALLRANPHWRLALAGGPLHGSLRGAGLVSLLCWLGAIVAGRWIGFLQ
jgi:hypothetical protein